MLRLWNGKDVSGKQGTGGKSNQEAKGSIQLLTAWREEQRTTSQRDPSIAIPVSLEPAETDESNQSLRSPEPKTQKQKKDDPPRRPFASCLQGLRTRNGPGLPRYETLSATFPCRKLEWGSVASCNSFVGFCLFRSLLDDPRRLLNQERRACVLNRKEGGGWVKIFLI